MIGPLRAIVEWSLVPFDHLPPWLGLTLVSVLTGVFALLVVRWTTNQVAVAAARDQMSAAILEMRLWLDSPKRVLMAQGRMLAWTGRYVGRTLPALVLLAVPLSLAFLNLEMRHARAGVVAGGDALLRVDGGTADLRVAGPLPASAPVFVHPTDGAAYVRVATPDAGRFEVELSQGSATASKLVVVGDSGPVSLERAAGWDALWAFGVEGPLAAGPISRISVEHPARVGSWLGMPWWGYWLVVSTGAALLLRKPLGVVI